MDMVFKVAQHDANISKHTTKESTDLITTTSGWESQKWSKITHVELLFLHDISYLHSLFVQMITDAPSGYFVLWQVENL